MRALVLSGGGALGAYEAGAISRMAQAKVEFDIVCGTSIGALNAAFVAQRRYDDLAIVWKTIPSKHIIELVPEVAKLLDVADRLKSFGSEGTLRKASDILAAAHDLLTLGPISALMGLLGGLSPQSIIALLTDYLDIERLQTSLIVSVTNLTSGASDAFIRFIETRDQGAFAAKHDKGICRVIQDQETFRDAVRASAAIPFAFPPVPIAGSDGAGAAFVDGGVANNTPIGLAIDAGADDITIVFLNPPNTHAPLINANLAQVGLNCFGIMQQRILDLDLASAKRVNAAVKDGAGGSGSSELPRREIVLREIRPASTLPLTVLEFDNGDLIAETYALGAADAARCLGLA